MNLADPELELIDPTPNIHGLFVHFDELFFFTKLMGRALVRWSKRMYSCAGVCSYEGRNGICDIALSEPLLKLRPRKDLIETLLHEMIHAFLFITNKDSDRDGHGPNFKAHMYRINKAAGLNISIYHSFHDEVNLYLKHWWRCNGKCQKMKPYFGVVRRSCNRAPGPSDHWWVAHKRICGGTFIKIKEPEKKPPAKKDKGKAIGNITKYINNNNPNTENKNLKSVDNKTTLTKISVEVVVSSAGPNLTTVPDIGVFIEGSKRKRSNSNPVIEKVRDVWKNKHIPTPSVTIARKVPDKVTSAAITKKHRTDSGNVGSPPNKVKKLDDYFKTTASSILKDVYGKEFIISQSGDSKKFKAITVRDSDCNKVGPVNEMEDFVKCPSCNIDVRIKYINRHLDECLNKDIIESLTKKSIQSTPKLKDVVRDIQTIPPFKFKTDNNHIAVAKDNKITIIEASDGNSETYKNISKTKTEKDNCNMEINAKPGTSKDFEPQKCPCCGNMVCESMNKHLDECLGFFDNNTTIPEEGTSAKETVVIQDNELNTNIKSEPSTSKDLEVQKCPCCGNKIETSIELHLDECLGFFDNNTTIPIEGGAAIETIVIDDDDDDIFDESQTFNATGTKSPCPCCLKMVENEDMNDHLDVCLGT